MPQSLLPKVESGQFRDRSALEELPGTVVFGGGLPHEFGRSSLSSLPPSRKPFLEGSAGNSNDWWLDPANSDYDLGIN